MPWEVLALAGDVDIASLLPAIFECLLIGCAIAWVVGGASDLGKTRSDLRTTSKE